MIAQIMFVPKYSITNVILRNIGIIEACREVIRHAPLLPFYEKKFQNEALVRSVHFGTHIEGNELNLSQAERVVKGQQVIARQRDIQEVINYREVIEYIGLLEEQNKKEITEELLLHLHKLTVTKILPEETSGTYRKSQVVIKSSSDGEIAFRPPAPIAVSYQIHDLIAFINNKLDQDIHPVLKSAIVHYELVRIHPFIDGNGRVARALSTLILFLEGYDIRKFFSLEEYFDSDAGRYYTALQSVEKNNNDLTEWLSYFTQGLSIELSKIKEKVEIVSVDAKLKEKLGGKPLMLSDRQLKIIEYIQKTGYLENRGFKSLFPMISEDSVLLDLQALVKAGIVRKHGVTKGAKYIMS
jgi:Fic family protein